MEQFEKKWLKRRNILNFYLRIKNFYSFKQNTLKTIRFVLFKKQSVM